MKIRHLFPSASSRQTITGDRGFFLRNQIGDFLSQYTSTQSRYQGWFMAGDQTNNGEKQGGFFKILDSLDLLGKDGKKIPVTCITNVGNAAGLQNFQWEYSNGQKIIWQMAPDVCGIKIFSTLTSPILLRFDFRQIYAHPQMDRLYQIKTEADGSLLVIYRDPTLASPLYASIRFTGQFAPWQTWEETYYPRDAARHSEPSRLYTYNLGTFTTSNLSLGAGWTAQQARAASSEASALQPEAAGVGLNFSKDNLTNRLRTAQVSTESALRFLQTQDGIYAGLPWFHQVWSRDELIAALGLPAGQQQDIIERYLGLTLEYGELPTYQGSHSTCADGVGWLCLLVKQFGLENLSEETDQRLLHFLLKAKEQLDKHRKASHGFIYSGHNATWMDTIGRLGYRLEIQCAYALILQILFSLTGDDVYGREHIHFTGLIRQHFYKNGYLFDGIDDPDKRPNVFLAYLLQPNLLNERSWKSCFDIILQATWLTWGGLSSLDQNHPSFQPVSTGQDNLSYHNGDSWFFVNNLAAVSLRRFNARLYQEEIVGILQSSTKEILEENFVGCPGEISSAEKMDSWGCGIQAFSGGTYLALLNELESATKKTYNEHDRDWIDCFWESTAASTSDNFFK